MDALSKLSRETQVVLVGGVLLFILSFLDWQQLSLSSFGLEGGPTVGANEWHGIGILAGLLVVAMLAWEVLRLLAADVSVGTLSPGLVSVGLALLMALFTLIAFLDKSEFRHWPAWVALIVALVVAVAAVARARAEGVQIPQAGAARSVGSTESAESPVPADPVETPPESS
jgi:hypothetical protein